MYSYQHRLKRIKQVASATGSMLCFVGSVDCSRWIILRGTNYREVKRYKHLQLVSDTGTGRGMRCDEAPILMSEIARVPANHACRTMGWRKWNETKCMRRVWRNDRTKCVVGENGRNHSKKSLPRPHFVHNETHMEWPRCEFGTPAEGRERVNCKSFRICKIILHLDFQDTSKLMHIKHFEICILKLI